MADQKKPDGSADAFEHDLFGAPVDQMRDRWGRPSFAKNQENQLLVATLKSAGWNQKRIARYLGCDEKTLRKHFSRELEAGSDLIEGQSLQVLVSKMRQGNLPATKRVLDIVEKGNAAPPPKPNAKPEEAEEKEIPLGKKEEKQLAARSPGAGWGNLLN